MALKVAAPGEVQYPLAAQFLEVKLPQENINDKMFLLSGLLNSTGAEPGKINYIDLRFDEPAIKYKDAKTK
jgi:hypothetical protein